MDYDILLIKEFSGNQYGSIMTVGAGLYTTLINRKIGVPISCLEEINEKKSVVISYQELEKDYEDLCDQLNDEQDENYKLKDRIEELEKCKDKRSIKTKKKKKEEVYDVEF